MPPVLRLFACHRLEHENGVSHCLMKWPTIAKSLKSATFSTPQSKFEENLPWMIHNGHTKFQPERSNSVGRVLGLTNRQADEQISIYSKDSNAICSKCLKLVLYVSMHN